jgi:thiol-disulfide isomerase/thioredoxin
MIPRNTNVNLLTNLIVLLACSVAVQVQAFQPSLPIQQAPVAPAGSSKTRRSYSAAVVAPPATDTFEVRLRNLLHNKQQKRHENMARNHPSGPEHVAEVHSLREFKMIVTQEAHQVTAVRYYAGWCKACRAIEPRFYRLGRQYTDIKYAQVPVTSENAGLHEALGVETLPFGHIYHPVAGLVEELSLHRRNWLTFEKILLSYNDGECVLPDMDPVSGIYEAPYDRAQ